MDHGTEFMSKALEEWAYQRGVKLDFTHPGKPTENGHIESFNGRLRDECLNVNQFNSLDDAQAQDRSVADRLQCASSTQLARPPDTERVREKASGATDLRSSESLAPNRPRNGAASAMRWPRAWSCLEKGETRWILGCRGRHSFKTSRQGHEFAARRRSLTKLFKQP